MSELGELEGSYGERLEEWGGSIAKTGLAFAIQGKDAVTGRSAWLQH